MYHSAWISLDWIELIVLSVGYILKFEDVHFDLFWLKQFKDVSY